MKRSLKLPLVFSLIAMLSLLVAGIAGAQDDDPGGEPQRPLRDRAERFLGGDRGEIFDIITEETGLNGQAIIGGLRDGQTVAELIAANGGSVEAVSEAFITNATERINAAVEAGRIDQDQADMLIDGLDAQLGAILSGDGPLADRRGEGRPGPRGDRRGGAGDFFNNVIADNLAELDLDRGAVFQAMRDGQSFSEALVANGVDAEAFIEDMTADLEAELDAKVAEGTLTQERADAILERLNDFITNGFQRTPRV